MITKNRDKKQGNKRAERQTQIAGPFTFHRYDKAQHFVDSLSAQVKSGKGPKPKQK